MKCFRILPPMWARTRRPSSSSTRNIVFGSASRTMPSTSTASARGLRGGGPASLLRWPLPRGFPPLGRLAIKPPRSGHSSCTGIAPTGSAGRRRGRDVPDRSACKELTDYRRGQARLATPITRHLRFPSRCREGASAPGRAMGDCQKGRLFEIMNVKRIDHGAEEARFPGAGPLR
jgi:hypothetical protein